MHYSLVPIIVLAFGFVLSTAYIKSDMSLLLLSTFGYQLWNL